MLDIQSHMYDSISELHIDYCQINQIRKIKIYVFVFILTVRMLRIILSIRCKFEVIIIFKQILLGSILIHKIKTNAFILKMFHLSIQIKYRFSYFHIAVVPLICHS